VKSFLPSTRPKNNDGCLLSFYFVSHLQNTIPKIVEPIFRSDFLCLTMILCYFFRCHSLLLQVFIQFEAYYQLNFLGSKKRQNCFSVKFEFSLVLAVNYLFLVRVSQLPTFLCILLLNDQLKWLSVFCELSNFIFSHFIGYLLYYRIDL
jgi:hypothetical protein